MYRFNTCTTECADLYQMWVDVLNSSCTLYPQFRCASYIGLCLQDSDASEQNQSVRTLDEVVSELDMILRQRLCSRTDLIRAIENQLHINISGDNKEEDVKEVVAKGPRHSYQNMEYLSEVQVPVSPSMLVGSIGQVLAWDLACLAIMIGNLGWQVI